MYTITFNGVSAQFGTPTVLPQPGEVLVANFPFVALSGSHYEVGDRFELLHRTNDAPHGRLSSLGNWLVRCKDRVSVWTNIEMAMYNGLIGRIR